MTIFTGYRQRGCVLQEEVEFDSLPGFSEVEASLALALLAGISVFGVIVGSGSGAGKLGVGINGGGIGGASAGSGVVGRICWGRWTR